ncbi:hypothetical protein ACX9I7_12780 [Streptomyces sp. L500]
MCSGTTRPATAPAQQSLVLGTLGRLCIAVSLVGVVGYAVNFLAHDRMPSRSISTLSVALATGILALLTCGLRRARRLLIMICCGSTVLSVDRFAHSAPMDHAAMAFLLAASVYAVPAWPEIQQALYETGHSSIAMDRREMPCARRPKYRSSARTSDGVHARFLCPSGIPSYRAPLSATGVEARRAAGK